MDVLISIVGVQQLDGDSDTIELTTDGTLEPTADGYRLRYEVTGLEGAMTTLHIAPGQVMLERSGSLTSLLVLEKGKRHLNSYETPYGNLMIGAYTDDLSVDLTEKGGRLGFRYTLDMNGSVTGRHDVRISVRPAGA